MKQFVIVLYVLILLIGVSTLAFTLPSNIKHVIAPLPTNAPIQLNSKKIFNLINDYRVSQGVQKLIYDSSICSFTQKRLHQIHKDFSHTGFSPEVYSSYQFHKAGENIIFGNYYTEQPLVKAWINSPEHRENIVNPTYTRTCVATDTYQYQQYAVQEFANY